MDCASEINIIIMNSSIFYPFFVAFNMLCNLYVLFTCHYCCSTLEHIKLGIVCYTHFANNINNDIEIP